MQYHHLIHFILLLAATACTNTGEYQENPVTELSLADTLIGNQGSQAPFLYTSPDGTLYLSWIEKSEDSSRLQFSRLMKNGSWSEPQTITSGTDWFVNWADFPMLSTGDDVHFLAHTLRKRTADTYAYDIHLSRSRDGGESWEDAGLLHDDGLAAEHGFVSMVPYGENFFVSWLDGRNTVPGTADHTAGDHSSQGAMTLRAAIVSSTGEKTEEWELDHRVCDCCQTSAVITSQGPVVAYRNRSKDEIRDIYVTRLENNAWTTPEPVHDDGWQINGCPVNGPKLAARDDQLALVWFTGAGDSTSVKAAFSRDAGTAFTAPVILNEGAALGRVDALWLSDEVILATWMEDQNIIGAIVHRDGQVKSRFQIGRSEKSRASGFPRIARQGETIHMAYTLPAKGQINTVRFQIQPENF